MPFEITQLLDAVPKGRIRKVPVDKYAAYAEVVNQIPQGKIAQFTFPKDEYRAFSASMRAAGERVGKRVSCLWKNGSAYVTWVTLTEENRRKRRGRKPKAQESVRVKTPILDLGQEEPEDDRPELSVDEIDPSLIGDMDAEVPPDVAIFQEEARRRQRRKRS